MQTLAALLVAASPLALHPANPRVFEFRGQPTLLLTSGEHYGAVLNLDFDYVAYLDELAACGLNLTRTFSGVYREVPGSFGITGNTLAPKSERWACPFVRDGAKFDLSRVDEAYFARLTDFMKAAAARGVVVEYVLFCPLYNDALWRVHPFNPSNNVNALPACASTDVHSLRLPALVALQDAFVRRVATVLNGFDNLYYEICNEPYFGGCTLEWQAHIAATLADTERALPNQHLIAQNIANNTARVDQRLEHVSIYNFHYAAPPVAVADNWHLQRPIGFDETGFAGSDDRTYRIQAWEFMLAGGSVFSNLDYSFRPDTPAGTSKPQAPGGGGRRYRRQLATLRQFLGGFDLVKLQPLTGWVNGPLDAGLHARALAVPGQAYAVYFRVDHPRSGSQVRLDLPAGAWQATWLDPRDGQTRTESLTAGGGLTDVKLPAIAEDLALKLVRP